MRTFPGVAAVATFGMAADEPDLNWAQATLERARACLDAADGAAADQRANYLQRANQACQSVELSLPHLILSLQQRMEFEQQLARLMPRLNAARERT